MDYDAVADDYDRRYLHNDYNGVERTLRDFVGDARAVLEAGCGTGHWLAFIAGQPRSPQNTVGLDTSSAMLRRARAIAPDAHIVRGHAGMLPFGPACFDRAFCVNALHHFDDKPAFIEAARSVLRPGGGLLTVQLDPHGNRDRWWIYDCFPEALVTDRARYPAVEAIRQWMRNVGFARCHTTVAQHMELRRSAQVALSEGAADRSATSQLTLLSEEAYALGMRKLREAIVVATARGETPELSTDLTLYATVGWVA
jgi:ubiquinone/menaquinone biosynthesis C-methylase UbiE